MKKSPQKIDYPKENALMSTESFKNSTGKIKFD